MKQALFSGLVAACMVFPLVAQVEVTTDIAYLPAANYADDKDKLDVYRPDGATDAPVFIFVHGGGLMRGDKEGQAHIGQYFARHGFVTVCINTRLSPAVTHPAHARDAAAAVAWVEQNIADHGGDPARIALGGHSAGAYLAALVALDDRYLKAAGTSPAAIRALVPVSGFYWVERLAPERDKSVWGNDEKTWRDASPSRYASAMAPPTLLIWADGDTDARRKESHDLASTLLSFGAERVDASQIADRNHGTVWSLIGSEGDPAAPRIARFLEETLGGP